MAEVEVTKLASARILFKWIKNLVSYVIWIVRVVVIRIEDLPLTPISIHALVELVNMVLRKINLTVEDVQILRTLHDNSHNFFILFA